MKNQIRIKELNQDIEDLFQKIESLPLNDLISISFLIENKFYKLVKKRNIEIEEISENRFSSFRSFLNTIH